MDAPPPPPVQIRKIKRRRDPSHSAMTADAEAQRTRRAKRMHKETVKMLEGLHVGDAAPERRSRVSRRLKLPVLAQFVKARWRQRFDPRRSSRRSPRTRTRTRLENSKLNDYLRDAVAKFRRRRQEAIPEAHLDYYVALYRQQNPNPAEAQTIHELLIDAYKSSTDPRERRRMIREFTVVRAMVEAEEGPICDDTDTVSSEADYDYYLNDDDYEAYFDEEGNVMTDIAFEVCEDQRSDPDDEFYSGNDYPSDPTDSAKEFESDDEMSEGDVL